MFNITYPQSSLVDVIKTEIHNNNDNTRTAFPAVVVGVNNTAVPSVTVKILNQRYTDDGENMDDLHILNVPVALTRTSSSLIIFPIRVGDTGMCICADNSLDNFKIASNANPTKVGNNRMKDEMDAVFYPGLAPPSVVAQQYQSLKLRRDANDLVIIHNAGTGAEANVTIKADGNVEINSQFTVKVIAKDIELNASNSVSINASSLKVNVPNTTWTGNNTIVGLWKFNGIAFDTHKHVGVIAGNGVSGLPTV
ncbi:Gp138 family membrane-puncturing spike protein [Pseudomonas viridiflava]|uniref:Gp138 family membrane-puncturing spike protein n=1 Tax=Pseudomonas viridiflava TaxID=33069 RepID=UPI002EC468B4|nr:Gp138 family membrane-puncturing spike protein [Pseudomonas viridiflava]